MFAPAGISYCGGNRRIDMKRILLFALLLLAGILLLGCGSDSGTKTKGLDVNTEWRESPNHDLYDSNFNKTGEVWTIKWRYTSAVEEYDKEYDMVTAEGEYEFRIVNESEETKEAAWGIEFLDRNGVKVSDLAFDTHWKTIIIKGKHTQHVSDTFSLYIDYSDFWKIRDIRAIVVFMEPRE